MPEKKLTQTQLQGELGYPGLNSFSGLPQETWIPSLYTNEKRIKKYDEIYRYDPTANAMIKITSMFMCGTRPQVEMVSNSQADVGAAEFLESCLFDMSRDWLDIMSDIVNFMVYGYFDMEIVYWLRNGEKSQFDDGRIGWRKFAPRHPITLDKWEFDANGGLQGMHQLGPPDYRSVYIPIEKLLHFTTTGMGKNNPEGSSVLEGAYKPFFYASSLEVIEGILAERASGTPYVKLPEGATTDSSPDSDLERAKKIVRNVKVAEDMGITLPFGFEFGYATPTSGPVLDIGEVILRHRRDLARVLMMDFIMLGGGDQGSWALSKDKSQLYIRSMNTFLKKIASVINRHGVPRLFSLNAFPGISSYPKVYFTPITKIDIGDFAEVMAKLFNSGAMTYDMNTENYIRRETGVPEITEPGISFRQPAYLGGPQPLEENPGNAPDQGSDDKKDGDRESGLKESPDEMEEFAEIPSGLNRAQAAAYTEKTAGQILNDYDRFIQAVVTELADAPEEDWEAIVAEALQGLSRDMLGRLRTGMFYVWNETTNYDPSVEGLRALLGELDFQYGYLENSLLPDLEKAIMQERRDLEDKAATRAMIVLALTGILGAFRYRASMYAGGVYKVWANYARPTAIFGEMQDAADLAGVALRRDWATGKILGEGVLARYVGPDDDRTCKDCEEVIEQGWMQPERVPSIGTLRCDGSCRHTIEYKFRGRIYS